MNVKSWPWWARAIWPWRWETLAISGIAAAVVSAAVLTWPR